jgi:hypothetical protein
MAKTEEEVRAAILKSALEEQERMAAEEQAQHMQQETHRLYEETQRLIREHTEFTKSTYEEIGRQYKDVMGRLDEEKTREFEAKWLQTFGRWGQMLTQTLNDVLQRSMRRSIDSVNVGDLQPGFGKAGAEIGKTLGTALGTAVGGPLVGQILGTLTGVAVPMLAMQAEGYNMIGARTAPIMYGGGRSFNKDFEVMGREYRLAINDIVKNTAATAEEVGRGADMLAKIGIGFREGGKAEVEFALQADRMLQLTPGRTLKMETDLVTRYGEAGQRTKTITREMAQAMAEFTVIQGETGSAIARTFQAGNTLSNTLEQIASSARNSGASMEAVNSIAISLITTMAQGQGREGMRPEALAVGVGHLMGGLMPQAQGDANAEARRSGIDRILLERTQMGRRLIRSYESEGSSLGMADRDRHNMIGFLGTVHMSRQGSGRLEAMRDFSSKILGLADLMKDPTVGWEGAMKMVEGRGITGQDLLITKRISEELAQRGALAPGTDPTRAMMALLRQHKDDPEYKDTIEKFRNFTKEAKKQAHDSQAALDKIANQMTVVSAWFNENYWTKGRDAIAEAFGMEKKPGMLKMLGAAVADPFNTGAAAMQGVMPSIRKDTTAAMRLMGVETYQQSQVHQETMHLTDETSAKIPDQASRSRSGLEVTGN